MKDYLHKFVTCPPFTGSLILATLFYGILKIEIVNEIHLSLNYERIILRYYKSYIIL